jgi:hypothetical protein
MNEVVSGRLSVVGLIKRYWVWVALVLLTIPAWRVLVQPGYFSMHDDMQAVRQLEMDICFSDGQIPCRWTPDLGYGYGYPLFNYYPPLPYLIGQVFVWLGVSFLDTVKVVGILGFIASGVTMYLLGREFWGRWGGLVSAVFYVYAPYHAADFYVRGAMNEFWAMAWFPLILWVSYRLIKENSWRWVPGLAVSYALLLLSHNGMAMIFTMGLMGWVGLWCIKYQVLGIKGINSNTKYTIQNTGRAGSNPWKFDKTSVLVKLVVSGVWAVALAGFFFLPVVFEQRHAHVETLIIGYFNYLAHFVDLRQLFLERTWGFGASWFGPEDEMGFQIGHLHWIVGALGVIGVSIQWARLRGWLGKIGLKSKIKSQKSKLQVKSEKLNGGRVLAVVYVFLLTMGYAFMSHYRSAAIWKTVSPLEFLQFPWRFLAVIVLGFSFLAGAVVWVVGRGKLGRLGELGVVVLIGGVIVLNVGYFVPREWYPEMTDEKKFSGKEWQLLITSGIFDYLPIQLPLPPADPPPTDVEVFEGVGRGERVFKKSDYQEYRVVIEEDAKVRLNTFYFPGWRYFVDGEEVGDYLLNERNGVPEFEMSAGEYQLVARFTDTPVRKVGNWVTVVGLVGLGGWGLWLKKRIRS